MSLRPAAVSPVASTVARTVARTVALALVCVVAVSACLGGTRTGPGPTTSAGIPGVRASATPSGQASSAGATDPAQPTVPTGGGKDVHPAPWTGTLPNLRPGPILGPRPGLAALHLFYQSGYPPVATDPRSSLVGWRLRRPGQATVAGYAGADSVLPGGTLDLHLRSSGGPVRLDVFRMGRNDAHHLLTVRAVLAGPWPDARPDPLIGLVDEHWPVSTTLAIPATWRSGVYLVKLTAQSGAQSYVLFVVRTADPKPVLVVLPTLTYQAYNPWGGASLYGWSGAPAGRAYLVGFDRPYSKGWGAGGFFSLDFPLIVWLEDHGYTPAYATDVDVSNDPALVTGARAVIFSGHAEYWTAALRDAMDAAQAAGVSLLNMGANAAWWQVRLERNSEGAPDRQIVGYKNSRVDPLALTNPQAASARFIQLPHPRPASALFGEDYGGIVLGVQPLVLGPDVARFAPRSGLHPGQLLPGLIGDEIDTVSSQPGATLIGVTPVLVRHGSQPLDRGIAGASAWLTPSGAHVFDAGTFDWSWGLDPRYAAALPGFPASGFAQLNAAILAWAGVLPTVPGPR